MLIFPAIDLLDGHAVRLYKGDYEQVTVYADDPLDVVKAFREKGASHLHLVDLNGAKSGNTDNFPTIKRIAENAGMFTELGGGIRNIETVKAYIDMGIDRVILGTAAVTDEEFFKKSLELFGDKIAVGVDLKDGYVAIKGWTEKSLYTADELFAKLEALKVSTVICTDISRDGAMKGTNRELYRELSSKYSMNITASGGVSSMDDIRALCAQKLYAAIIGKAYYTGAIDLKEAIEEAE